MNGLLGSDHCPIGRLTQIDQWGTVLLSERASSDPLPNA